MFSVYNSAYVNVLYFRLKECDLFYKTNFVRLLCNSKNSVVLTITFKDIKTSNQLVSTIFGFGLQIFFSSFSFFNCLFGFKQKIKFISFIMRKQEIFNEISFFFFSNMIYKAISLGIFKVPEIFGACTVKFFVSDLFSFFGVRFFSKFYLDFFDWPSKMVFTYTYFNFKARKSIPLFFSCFKICNF